MSAARQRIAYMPEGKKSRLGLDHDPTPEESARYRVSS